MSKDQHAQWGSRIPDELVLMLNSAGTKWKSGQKEEATEILRRAYEMAEEFPEKVKGGAILRILDALLSFGLLRKGLEIAKKRFKDVQGEKAEHLMERVNLLVRIAKIKARTDEASQKEIDRAFSLLEQQKEEFPAEYLSFSTAVLIPFLEDHNREEEAITRLQQITQFAKDLKERNKRLNLLLAEALTSLADLQVEKNTEESLKHYDTAYGLYERYGGFLDEQGEIIVNESHIYLEKAQPKKVLEVIAKIEDKVESQRVKIGLLSNKAEALAQMGKEKKAKEVRSEIQEIRENLPKF